MTWMSKKLSSYGAPKPENKSRFTPSLNLILLGRLALSVVMPLWIAAFSYENFLPDSPKSNSTHQHGL